jgi:hypothetical protein
MKPTGLLTAKQAAAWLAVSERTLRALQLRKVHVGKRAIRYDVRDLQQYADLNGTRPPMRSTAA